MDRVSLNAARKSLVHFLEYETLQPCGLKLAQRQMQGLLAVAYEESNEQMARCSCFVHRCPC